ncbi:MAG: glycosyltransferase family 4 protein [Bacteroidetes bacterium]|nr:glycosyltransferase family 4 protein [Bacteroidota bacterium]
MLRILQISNKAPFPPNDGSSIAVYNMAKGFIENGAELHLIAINTSKHFKPDKDVPADFKRDSHYLTVPQNTNTSLHGAFLNLFSGQSYFVSRFCFRAMEKALEEKLTQHKFDIIQLDGLFVAGYIDLIRKYSTAKIVLRAHNVESILWNRHLLNEKSAIKRTYLKIQVKKLKRFEESVIKKVDAIVSITDVDKKTFQELAPGKPVTTCITGVNVDYYKKPGDRHLKQKTIFYFASMDWMPNQEAADWFLSNCWKKVFHAVHDCKLVIAGKNMPQRFLKLNQPNVLVIGNINNSKDFYNQHDIMLVPLLTGSGLRIKIIEGMSYGKAIVSTTVGAEGIPVTHGKNILIADNPDDFSAAVIELLNNDEKRHSLESEAQKLAEKEFDNKKVVANLLSFYESLHV